MGGRLRARESRVSTCPYVLQAQPSLPFPHLRLHPVDRVGRPVALQIVLRVEDDAFPLGGAGGEGILRVVGGGG